VVPKPPRELEELLDELDPVKPEVEGDDEDRTENQLPL
jgi:hypothetical protein